MGAVFQVNMREKPKSARGAWNGGVAELSACWVPLPFNQIYPRGKSTK
jgi:hypothetical protein